MKTFVVFAFTILFCTSSALAGGGPEPQYNSGTDCIMLANPPTDAKSIGYNSFGKGFTWLKLGECYKKPRKQADGSIKVKVQMKDEDGDNIAFASGKRTLKAEFKQPGTTTTTTTTTSVAGPVIVSLDDQLAQCKTDIADWKNKYQLKETALNDCLRARVKSLSSRPWRAKKWCDTEGKKLGLVWKKAKNKRGGYCDCPGGRKDWDKSKKRCGASGITTSGRTAVAVPSGPVNLSSVIPELEGLKAAVDALKKRVDGLETVVYKEHGPAIKTLQDEVKNLKTKVDAPHTHAVTPGAQITGPSVIGKPVRSFFFGPRIGGVAVFSAKPADNLGYGVLGVQLLHRSVEYAELVVGLEIGTDFTKKPYFGFEVAVQFKLAERFLLGVSGRYETFGLTAHLGGEQGRGLSVGPRIVFRAMSVMDIVLTINAGLHTQPVGWVETLATRLHLEFNF